MTDLQIYYISNNKKLNLDNIVPLGNKSMGDVYNEIKSDPYFCRGEESISYSHFLSIIRNDISLYCMYNERIAGVVNFMFNVKNNEQIINLNGICSPIKYAGQKVGETLMNTLIKIGKQTQTKYIYLECRDDVMKYYRDKFGFVITSSKASYDSDADSEEEDQSIYYHMRLDLSKVSGGKKRHRKTYKKHNYHKKTGTIRLKMRMRKRKLGK